VQQLSVSNVAVATRATHVRSTLLQQSLRGIRNQGNFQRWEAYIDPLHRDTILEAIAPSWLPIEVGLAHYLACDRFGEDDATLDKIGEGVGTQLQSTLLGVASKIVLSTVISQETINSCFLKLWPRLCKGGQLDIVYSGKIVTIELRAATLPKSRYFRGTFLGNVRAGSKLFGQKLTGLRALPYDEANDVFTVQLAHV
jgi:hypothetical protein